MIRIITIFAVLMCVLPARSAPLPYSCDRIREFVAKHGELAALRWAAIAGWTVDQVEEARKCRLPVAKAKK